MSSGQPQRSVEHYRAFAESTQTVRAASNDTGKVAQLSLPRSIKLYTNDGSVPGAHVEVHTKNKLPISKRVIDIIVAAAAVVLFSPVFVLLLLVIRFDGGSAFFRQTRLGRSGRKFEIVKFRTMVPNAELRLNHLLSKDQLAAKEWEENHKLKEDPRITPIGRFLRKTSLDELPQLINVLKGEMSLVGPRPIVDKEKEKYGRSFRYYTSVRPGMTGIWQISGRNDTSYSRRVAIDRYYSSKQSLVLDLFVLLRTPIHVVFHRTGY